jgi:hypothetical protein
MVWKTGSVVNRRLKPIYSALVMRAIFVLTLILTVAACATERTVLVNSQGDLLTCETTGSGFFGAISVRNQQQQCISDAETRGYRVKN